jgi:hypothetical protein
MSGTTTSSTTAQRTADLSDFLLFHVCRDPHSAQGADFEVPLWELGLTDDAPIEVEIWSPVATSLGTAKFSTSISEAASNQPSRSFAYSAALVATAR